MNKKNCGGFITFHPGYYIKDIIDDMEITNNEFAEKLNMTDNMLDDLLTGEIDLSEEMAEKLSQITGVSKKTWLNLQEQYEQKNVEITSHESLDSEKETFGKYFIKSKQPYLVHNRSTAGI